VWFLPLIACVIDRQGKGPALYIGPTLFVIPSTTADPCGPEAKLAVVLPQNQVDIGFPVHKPCFDRMADLPGCRT
jgi:hypothetical protein